MPELLRMSLSAGAMVVVLALLRGLLPRRLPARLRPWLWLPVGIRLLMPVEMPILPASAKMPTVQIPVQLAVREAATVAWVSAGGATQNAAAIPAQETLAAQPSPLLIIWLCGMAVTLIVLCLLRLYWYRRLARATQGDSAANQWLARQGFRRPVRVLVGGGVPAPMTCGLLRPRIYLPAGMDAAMLPYVLAHEGEHICHLHAAVKALMALALCLHWFNPLVWCMARMLGHDLEMACDAHVLRRLGDDNRKAYAGTLVRLATQRDVPGWMSAFAGHPIQERVVNMYSQRG